MSNHSRVSGRSALLFIKYELSRAADALDEHQQFVNGDTIDALADVLLNKSPLISELGVEKAARLVIGKVVDRGYNKLMPSFMWANESNHFKFIVKRMMTLHRWMEIEHD
jgi:hypothetical protein